MQGFQCECIAEAWHQKQPVAHPPRPPTEALDQSLGNDACQKYERLSAALLSGAGESKCRIMQALTSSRQALTAAIAHSDVNCLACNKMCDGQHECTEEHKKRVEHYIWQ